MRKPKLTSSRHVRMWKLDHKEDCGLKNWCLWTVLLDKTLESHLDSKEIKPVNLKGNQPWILNGRTYAEAEAPILGPPDAKRRLIGKDPNSGKDWGQEKGATEDGIVEWHHWLNRHELGQTPRDSEGEEGLAGCSSRARKESDNSNWKTTKVTLWKCYVQERLDIPAPSWSTS